jgi:hypothetical protein
MYTGFCAVIRFLKNCQKFLFLDILYLIRQLTAAWI